MPALRDLSSELSLWLYRGRGGFLLCLPDSLALLSPLVHFIHLLPHCLVEPQSVRPAAASHRRHRLRAQLR